jgi:hypothetical protein
MKRTAKNLFLSLLFAFVASFSAIHEAEHIAQPADTQCLICTVSNNLTSADAVVVLQSVEIAQHDKIALFNCNCFSCQIPSSYNSRAPPFLS